MVKYTANFKSNNEISEAFILMDIRNNDSNYHISIQHYTGYFNQYMKKRYKVWKRRNKNSYLQIIIMYTKNLK